MITPKIEITISTETTGANDADDNQRFLVMLKQEIQNEYPGADIDIEISDRLSSDTFKVSNDEDYDHDIESNLHRICNLVWNTQ